ncbi:hypothetical protein ACLOJK_003895 [Asimina triloba]
MDSIEPVSLTVECTTLQATAFLHLSLIFLFAFLSLSPFIEQKKMAGALIPAAYASVIELSYAAFMDDGLDCVVFFWEGELGRVAALP